MLGLIFFSKVVSTWDQHNVKISMIKLTKNWGGKKSFFNSFENIVWKILHILIPSINTLNQIITQIFNIISNYVKSMFEKPLNNIRNISKPCFISLIFDILQSWTLKKSIVLWWFFSFARVGTSRTPTKCTHLISAF